MDMMLLNCLSMYKLNNNMPERIGQILKKFFRKPKQAHLDHQSKQQLTGLSFTLCVGLPQ